MKIIEKYILMKTVIALKMRLTGRILVMIPTDQVSVLLFSGGIEWGYSKTKYFTFVFESHLVIYY